MLFSSISFIYIFLPVVLIVYYLVPRKAKNYVLLIASLLFYSFGEPVYTILLLISSVSGYLHSLFIEKFRGTKKSKYFLISSVAINLALLIYFKYIDFFISLANSVTGLDIPLTGVALPIGISFFTFQTMSYTIDVYRGDVHAQRNLATLATFVCLFPQLIAGPIVRYTDVATELDERRENIKDVSNGIFRFTIGLGKKVLIANAMGELCAAFRACEEKSVLFYWIYAIAFTLQIYFDFSGYSDMAIGLGGLFGFKFPENFDYPYVSGSATEFWRRWHMTLGTWFRDYVYIPLGGNRNGKPRWLLNILIVWFLTGFWHGAAWNFILWGLLYGVLLIIEKLWLGKILEKAKVFSHFYLLFFVIVGFVIFNASSISEMTSDIKSMFGFSSLPFLGFMTLYYLKSYGVLLAAAIIGATPLAALCIRRLKQGAVSRSVISVFEPLTVAVLLLCVTACLVDGSFNPFLYFRF